MDFFSFLIFLIVAVAIFLVALYYVIKNAVKAALEEERSDVARAAESQQRP